ncbi:hypothetical protein [Streptomyces capitiformicae]|uniref:hypothetical protein n=1 Tax=Streptomyces capitiformicae TaxID=2014920 RepID=UPI0016723B89|nr:hypothetical protein [Streptomyces capitiformicae]
MDGRNRGRTLTVLPRSVVISELSVVMAAPVADRPKQRGDAPFRGRGTRRGQPSGRSGGATCRSAEARQMADARKAARIRKSA